MKFKSILFYAVVMSVCFQFTGFAKDFEFQVKQGVDGFRLNMVKSGEKVQKIEVFQKDKLIQSLQVDGESDVSERYSEGSEYIFQVEDYNFDGYNDLAVLNTLGASNAKFDIYIYQPKSSQFVLNKELSSLMNLYVDKEKKLVKSHEKGGYAGLIYKDTVHKIERGKFVLIKIDEQDLHGEGNSKDGQKFKRVIAEKVKGKMIKVCEFLLTYDENGKATLIKIIKGTKKKVNQYLKEEN